MLKSLRNSALECNVELAFKIQIKILKIKLACLCDYNVVIHQFFLFIEFIFKYVYYMVSTFPHETQDGLS